MDYGERLSSMEAGEESVLRDETDRLGGRPIRLIKEANSSPKLVGSQNNPTTKCTTNQPINVDPNDINKKDYDETTSSPAEDDGINGDTDATGASDDATDDNLINGTTPASNENKVEPDDGLNQDPAKDDDYDATISTKKYFAPKASFFPDHYLDDA